MMQEKSFVIAVIVGITVIISTLSLVSLPGNSEHNEWWSYNTMRNKMIQSADPPNVIELEEGMKFQSGKDGT